MIRYIGYLAAVLTVVSFLPQVIRTWKTRHTKDLSLGMFALVITASIVWIVYGVSKGDWPVILTNSGLIVLNAALVAAKLKYR